MSGARLDPADVTGFLAAHPDVDAVGVRVVHGGAEFREPVLVDQLVEDRLAELADLAPLHDPPALAAVRAVRQACPRPAPGGLLRHGLLRRVAGGGVHLRPAVAALALSVYLHRLRGGIASMAAAMGGLDAVVFTGGVGPHSARIRAEACTGLEFLGIVLDPVRNAAGGTDDRDVAAAGGAVRVVVIQAREEQEIAREVRRLVV